MIPPEFFPLKKAFLRNNWQWEETAELFESIMVKNKEDMWLYNYSDNVLVSRNHPVVMKCRGLVARADGTILNFPFERFFNDFEKECAAIDWKTASIQEKLDGSLVCVFWNGKVWEITTRGSFYPNEKGEVNFSELFKKQFNGLDILEKNKCYMFEIVTKENRIVTWYDEEAVYLIGARSLATLNELSQGELDKLSQKLKVKRPKIFKAFGIEQCKSLFQELEPDKEGLVVVDSSFSRVKLKQESYLKLSKIKMLKEQDMFDYILGKTAIDEEYLQKLPEVADGIEQIRKRWNGILNQSGETFNKLKDKPTRKEFALEAAKHPYKALLFAMLDNKQIEKMPWKWEAVKEWG